MYLDDINRNNNHSNDSLSHLSEHPRLSTSDNAFVSPISPVVDKKQIIQQSNGRDIPCVPIKLPELIELQLRNNRLLKDAINTYRRQTRLSKSANIQSKYTMETMEDEDLLMIDSEPLCPTEQNDLQKRLSSVPSALPMDLRSLMKEIYQRCQNKVWVYLLIEPLLLVILNRTTIHQQSPLMPL